MKFTELNLSSEILAGLKAMNYIELTPIQELTSPHILAGKDLIARAETGSGKTGACAIPLVQKIDTSINAVQCLILVPTRELALQYVQEIAGIAQYTDVSPFAVYGGFSMQIQNAKFKHGVHILVATPGRLIDLLYNSPLSLAEVRTFVLDEADEMLNMGFIDDVEFVVSCLIHEHQTLLFSATMPKEIQRLARRYLKNPVLVELNEDQIAPQSLQHHFCKVGRGKRLQVLLDYLKTEQPEQAIIFCNSRLHSDKLFRDLNRKIESVDMIHGGMEQSKRTSLFNRFRRKNIKVMVATDIASRGLDFSHVSNVINYDFPASSEAYTHRTGRTARMGRKGIAMTFFLVSELAKLKYIIQTNGIEPTWRGEAPDLNKIHKTKPGSNRYRQRKNQGKTSSRRRSGKKRNSSSKSF